MAYRVNSLKILHDAKPCVPFYPFSLVQKRLCLIQKLYNLVHGALRAAVEILYSSSALAEQNDRSDNYLTVPFGNPDRKIKRGMKIRDVVLKRRRIDIIPIYELKLKLVMSMP